MSTSLSPAPRPRRKAPSRPLTPPSDEAPDALPESAAPPEPPTSKRAGIGVLKELRIDRAFGIDVRTLAAFRIAMALLLLNDLWVRAADITAFYSDKGVLPRTAAINLYYDGMPNLQSLHMLSGLGGYEAILFGIAGVFALCLLVGYRTRWVTLVSWVLLVSLHNRNPMVIAGGDVMMRMMLFWGMFLPLGRVWSLDRMRGYASSAAEIASPAETIIEAQPGKARVLSTATVAALLQMCFVYWFSVALKTGSPWRADGTAIFYALSIDQLVKPLGLALLPYPGLMTFLTHLTMGLERFGPALALLPWWRTRIVMVAVFIGFHIMLGLCLTLGLFPFAAAAGWMLFLPGEFWDLVAHYYLKLAPVGLKTRVEAVRAKVKAWETVWVAARPNERPLSPLQVVAPRAFKVLHQVKIGGLQAVALFFLLYISAWNVRGARDPDYAPLAERILPQSANWIAEATRTDQNWGMFAPMPLREDGWYVIPAKLENGTTVDLFRDGAPLSWEKPMMLSALYPNERWQKYTLNLWEGNVDQRQYYGRYLLHQWNENHAPDEQIVSMEIDYMREDSIPNANNIKPQKVVMWKSK